MPLGSVKGTVGEQGLQTKNHRSACLLRPFTVRPSHIDAHFPDIRHFLSLEPIEVRLDRRA